MYQYDVWSSGFGLTVHATTENLDEEAFDAIYQGRNQEEVCVLHTGRESKLLGWWGQDESQSAQSRYFSMYRRMTEGTSG